MSLAQVETNGSLPHGVPGCAATLPSLSPSKEQVMTQDFSATNTTTSAIHDAAPSSPRPTPRQHKHSLDLLSDVSSIAPVSAVSLAAKPHPPQPATPPNIAPTLVPSETEAQREAPPSPAAPIPARRSSGSLPPTKRYISIAPLPAPDHRRCHNNHHPPAVPVTPTGLDDGDAKVTAPRGRLDAPPARARPPADEKTSAAAGEAKEKEKIDPEAVAAAVARAAAAAAALPAPLLPPALLVAASAGAGAGAGAAGPKERGAPPRNEAWGALDVIEHAKGDEGTAAAAPGPASGSTASRARLGAAIARAGGGQPHILAPGTATSVPGATFLVPKTDRHGLGMAAATAAPLPGSPAPIENIAVDVAMPCAPVSSMPGPVAPVVPVAGIPAAPMPSPPSSRPNLRLNKFVRRLHDMLLSEKDSGIVEWRRGLLVLHSTDAFARQILPRYFNTKNFKTFRRQLNYYGFVHVRSFSAPGSATTALWVNRDLAKRGTESIGSVLMLKRVEPSDASRTAEGRRTRKEEAVSTVEEDIGISTRALQLEQIRSLALRDPGGPRMGAAAAAPSSAAAGAAVPMTAYRHAAPVPRGAAAATTTPSPPPSGAAAAAPPRATASPPSEIVLPNPWASVSAPLASVSAAAAARPVPMEAQASLPPASATAAMPAGVQEDGAANLLLMLSRSAVVPEETVST